MSEPTSDAPRPRKRVSRRRKVLIGLLVLLLLLGAAAWIVYGGGQHEGPGVVHAKGWPAAAVGERAARQRAAAADLPSSEAPTPTRQILFGDLHVHSTFSADAFVISLPLTGGEGAHPPADACDFARFCSALDFFAMTDHAESLTPQHWQETKDSVRQCNDVSVAGDPANPDLVAFLGYEWTQVGTTPETHYGHKNVIFRHLDEDKVAKRPIAAKGLAGSQMRGRGGLSLLQLASIPIRDFSNRQRYLDMAVFQKEVSSVPDCPVDVDSKDLPADCRERATTPQELFAKLDQQGHEAIVIPHGTTWGFYTPHGYSWDKQLTKAQRDPKRQFLIEVYSGHGNSEEVRPWRGMKGSDLDTGECPAPTKDYEPCCWRAGELVRAQCGDIPGAECEARVARARADYLAAGSAGHYSLPGAGPEDWAGCGQCRDCFAPAFNYRPGGSVQYIMAKSSFEEGEPYHERFGFIASSDNHTARPGTGYKEFARRRMTEASGPRSEAWRDLAFGEVPPKATVSRRLDRSKVGQLPPFQLLDIERQASFFLTGGLVAVHAEGRGRDAIWEAMQRKEVYGTSGDRILLWFDLTNGPSGAKVPMGGDAALAEAPRFVVRAVGALEQREGCPDFASRELGPERLDRICAGQCYNPGDERRRITRVEVVRIRPQTRPDEPVEELVEDPWRTLPCPAGSASCTVSFTDPDFVAGGREVLYYVRAIQEPTPAVNAATIRCQDEACQSVKPCYGDYRTPYDEDCLAPHEERAWSSPIFVRPAAAPAGSAP